MRSEALLLLLLLLIGGVTVLGIRRYRRLAASRTYRRMLESALLDGVLTPEEVAELERFRSERELTQAEARVVAQAVYRCALRHAAEDARLSEEEDAYLGRLRAALGLTEEDLGGDRETLGRLRLLARVEAGDLPETAPPIALVPHETCHWVTPASLADLLELPGRGQAGGQGFALSPAGTDPVPVAAQLESLRSREEVLPVDLGLLVVTNRRTVFRGTKSTVAVPHARLDTLVLYADGFRLDEPRGNRRAVLLVDDAELTGAVLLAAARRRLAEIRPTRRPRTA